MNNSSLGWKIFGLFVSIALIIGGLSGEWVLRGTDSSAALVVVGFLFLIWDIYSIATHKKQQAEVEDNNAELQPDGLHLESDVPDAQNIHNVHDNVKKQEDISFPPPPKYNGIQWFVKVLRQYADFSGRARRQEYWMFTLFNVIFYFAWAILTGIIFALFSYGIPINLTIAIYGYLVMMMLPGMAVTVRRLHDLGKSGWMILVGFIPLVGGIWLLILMFTEGESHENKYGPNPKIRQEPLNEKTKLKSAAITLTVTASFLVFANVMQAIAMYVGYDISIFTNLLNIITNIMLLVTGIFLLSGHTMHDLREKGKQAFLLLLITVSILFLSNGYYLIQNAGFFRWINMTGSLIAVLLYLSFGIFIASLLYFQQNRLLNRRVAVCVIVFAGLNILWRIFDMSQIGGGGSAVNFFGVFNFLLPVAFIILTTTYLSSEDQAVPFPVLMPAQGDARATASRFDGYAMKPYFTLEHKVGSRYHNAGELQKIDADQVEIGRDPGCEVRFDENFETVSRRHAAIIRDGIHWKLVPLSQTNSSFVNGIVVQREWFLQHGDEIQCAFNGPKFVFRTIL